LPVPSGPDERVVVTALGAVLGPSGLLLIRRNVEPFAGLWGIPGGKMRPGEHLDAAVRRELYEETGIRVSFQELCGVVTERVMDRGRLSASYLLMLCRLKRTGGRLRRSAEGEVRWFPTDDVRAMKRSLIPSDRMMLDRLFFRKSGSRYYRCVVRRRSGRYEVASFK